jgi:glycosyltransferase involved in cell wall biosynthesis
VLNQTIGFNNIQLILVNDGSTDNSEDICLNYKNIYNKNIIYIKLNHGGVSRARNEGLKHAKGLYINCLDSDDKWDSQAFKNIYSFFNINKDVDIVAGRIKNFELNDKYQYIDYKFKKTRVVNLTEDFNFIQFSAASCFFRRSSLNENKFDEEAFFAEDVKFINTILLKKPLFGVVREALYNCRKRSDSSSASQIVEENRDFYFKTVDLVLHFLISESKSLYNSIQPFIQFYIAYEILFRISIEANKFLDSHDFDKYSNIIINLLEQIEDKYLLNMKNFHPMIIMFALSKKYNRDLRYKMILKNESLFYSNNEMINLGINRDIITLNFLENKDNILHLEIEDRFWMPKETFYYFIQIGNNTYFPNYLNNSNYKLVTMFGVINYGRILIYDISLELFNDINDKYFLHFYICYNNEIIEIFPSIGRYTHIPPISNAYYHASNLFFLLRKRVKYIYILYIDEINILFN